MYNLVNFKFTEPITNNNLDYFADESGKYLFLYSETSGKVYPIIDDIPIILPPFARNANLEIPALEVCQNDVSVKKNSKLLTMIESTIHDIQSIDKKSWEWEDEEFWDATYEKDLSEGDTTNWNDRIWQRETIVNRIPKDVYKSGIRLLDVGCGEGQNFKDLFKDKINDDSVYAATDISMNALKLNRKRSNFKNSVFVLCSADHLPFKKEYFDIILLFGILHHTSLKGKILTDVHSILKGGGYCAVHEAIVHSQEEYEEHMTTIRKSYEKGNDSFHEERIIHKDLADEISKNRFKYIMKKEENSYYFFRLFRYFNYLLLKSKLFFRLYSFTDRIFISLFGSNLRKFKPTAVFYLLLK